MSKIENLNLVYYDNNKENHIFVNNYSNIDEYLNNLNNMPQSIYKKIILDLFTFKYAYKYADKKKIMQCLRHFDEIGISNELWEDLDSIPKTCDYFLLCKDKVPDIVQLNIIKEEI